ncbi:hypothetical protein [Stieleria marina]|uniref:hypothetical protein n=1 Tax=Stieleria marina TaxID=1930275 RepID=UPI003AF34700
MKLSTLRLLKAAAALLMIAMMPISQASAQQACDLGCSNLGCSDLGCSDMGCASPGCSDLGCDSGCDSACFDRISDKLDLCGWVRPSDRCFDDFISPMINFVFFEDPRNVTELRPIFVTHNVPESLGGGSIQLYALQFRIALTERLSLIAVKDGYIVDNTDGAIDTLLDDGWADVSAGLKYNLLRDVESGTLASFGFTYEIPLGSEKALQGLGDGEFHVFGTAGQRLLDGNAHILSSVGYRFPVDDDVQSSSIHWSNHLDVKLTDRVYAFTENAWWHWTDDADTGLALGVAGQDLFNLPVNNVDGNDLVTQNVGLKFKPRRSLEAGIAYEFPLTGFEDVIEDRVTLDLIMRY